MRQPKKWRETCNPFELKLNNFKIKKILGYPHAGNDVFYCLGFYNNISTRAFIKVQRQKDANIKREIDIINRLDFKFVPQILEHTKDNNVVITKEIKGEKLSNIVYNYGEQESVKYMQTFGETLAKIHTVKNIRFIQKTRRFQFMPSDKMMDEINIKNLKQWLIDNKPKMVNKCFCHGDFHYANILWKNQKIIAVLDYEMSGIGNKEFDIAWSIILRPSQKFMKTQKEIDEFLLGYSKFGTFNLDYVKYYMIQIYCYFYFVGNEVVYKEYIKNWIKNNIK